MNEANTMADITGQQEPPISPARMMDTAVLTFLGYLTADIPELHGVHPQRLADAWERFKACPPVPLFQDER
jgi:hypothetical protein